MNNLNHMLIKFCRSYSYKILNFYFTELFIPEIYLFIFDTFSLLFKISTFYIVKFLDDIPKVSFKHYRLVL